MFMMSNPLVSVVIPTYNEVDTLRLSLPTIFNQSYDNFEIILVDDGSNDDTAAYANDYAEKHDIPFTLISQKNAGAAAARNTGWQQARGDIVAFIDTGCHADEQWLSDLVLSMGDAGGIGGKIILTRDHNALTRYQRAARQYRHRVKDGRVEYLITANAAFRRDALEKINGFRTWRGVGGEDVDLSYRIVAAGYQLAVAEKAIIHHHDSPHQLGAFARKYFKRGYANYYYSVMWQQLGYHRHPAIELIRRLGAIILSPYLAFRYASRTTRRDFPMYVIIGIVEHAVFFAGIVKAMIKRDRYQPEGD
jgi:glycosyltransferase involved in cell wall biosynthesis